MMSGENWSAARIGPWLLREDRKPRRRQRGEVYSTDDVKPPTRRVQRVVSEARLEVALGSLYSALPGIRAAYMAAVGSAGVASCASLEARVDGTPRGSGGADRSGAWLDFARRLTADQSLAIVAVAVRGETFREAERANRKRNGWAAQNVRAACQVWFGPHVSLRRQRLNLRAWRD